MKCEKCGSNISINDKYCPNCGTRNDYGAKHVDAMKRFEKRFSDTEKDVRNRSGWFIKYITPMIVFVISLAVLILFLVLFADSGYGYAEKKIQNYNKKHAQEIDDKLTGLMDEGEFSQIYMLEYIAEQKPADDSSEYGNGWNAYYNALNNYCMMKKNIISWYVSGDDYYGESKVSTAARAINEFYVNISEKRYYSPASESVGYINDIKVELENFLRAYCGFTDEDIEQLPRKDTTGIVSLLTRRMMYDE